VFDAIVGLFDPSSRRTSLATSVESTSTLELPKSEGSQIRAAAKSHRKIEDLEITNRSLLAINSSLEATKHKQAKEIRDLRRKLRESRLILPPRAYRAIKSSDPTGDEDLEDDDEDDDEVEGEVDDAVALHDETYRRVRGLLDGLLEAGHNALASTPEDHRGTGGAKVLSAEEIMSWRDDRSDVREAGNVSLDLESDLGRELDTSVGPSSDDEDQAMAGFTLPSVKVTMSP